MTFNNAESKSFVDLFRLKTSKIVGDKSSAPVTHAEMSELCSYISFALEAILKNTN